MWRFLPIRRTIDMKQALFRSLRVVLLIGFAGAAARAQCVPGGLAIVVNKANTTESLSVAQLRRLILGDIRTWPDKKPVLLISREASSDVFKCVLSSIVRMSDAEYHRYIVGAEFRGGDPLAVKTVASGDGAAKAIAGSAGSIAVVPASEVLSLSGTVRVVRVNGKEPGEAGYPF
jgi:ABC-type phosphate transport system substrate-binding protein